MEKVKLENGEVIWKVKEYWPRDIGPARKVTIDCTECKNTRKRIRIGDRLLYAIFSGTGINFKQKGVVRIMHENEVMSRIYGGANLGEIVK